MPIFRPSVPITATNGSQSKSTSPASSSSLPPLPCIAFPLYCIPPPSPSTNYPSPLFPSSPRMSHQEPVFLSPVVPFSRFFFLPLPFSRTPPLSHPQPLPPRHKPPLSPPPPPPPPRPSPPSPPPPPPSPLPPPPPPPPPFPLPTPPRPRTPPHPPPPKPPPPPPPPPPPAPPPPPFHDPTTGRCETVIQVY